MLDFKRWFSFTLPTQRVVSHKPIAMIEPYSEQREIGAVVLGLASDLSLNYFDAHSGAKDGPNGIRRALAALPVSASMSLYDAGVIDEQDIADTTESSFDAMRSIQYQKLRDMLQLGHMPIMLGGGHEVAIASYQALSDTVNQAANDMHSDGIAQIPHACEPRVGIINIDANFQLRRTLAVRAGSAFHTVASDCQAQQREFHYLGLGMCDHTNTQATFAYAKELGAQWLLDSQMKMKNRKHIQATVKAYLDKVDHVHLSIDLGVFSSAIAEGVNMSRIYGVNLAVVEMVIKQIMASGKVRIMDMAGLNTEFDYQNHTAKLAAKLIQYALKNA
ncbi:arginase family protein [Photobacterium nomapromontoriensis]|uniref:arginase family protein n=1 Tax=Photobacterium nomapromontoriensis TaxID=2910237 RepID=UPI003D0DACE9